MTLRHFKIFVAVCDNMNMTAAAEALFMSQSAVSQAIAELEKHYGIRLFERLTRKLYLTQAGEKLLSYARHMIRMNTDIEKDMKALHNSGSISLGTSVTVGSSVLPQLVSAFKRLKPKVLIRVFEGNTKQIENRILHDQTDIAIVEGDIFSPDIVNMPFMDDELVLICGVRHRFSAIPVIEPQELKKEDFISRENGSGTRKTFEDVMSANDLSWNEVWTCNNADTIKMAVAEGLGISVISKRAVASEVKSGILLAKEIKGLRFDRKFKMVFHKNKYLTEAMKNFITLCAKINI
ncbi:HTH-type transcriptional activator CmpR [Oxobacter pfennigii]|uniref:HTH-type transcriptional activator CmpR n=1 Tax=Oxobacter pfennigii TaxID=36849 RepID=A0A0P8W204_9CLOT|nr:LysR family transcriptional regulator [Oxobacter pfennigii]KPU42571.1 HTH-type transcriptional activator CmpR [Oxobacter pfennigii]